MDDIADKKTYCANCDAWDPINPKAGICRRNAPSPGSGPPGAVSRFPVVKAGESCFQGIPKKKKPETKKKTAKSKSSQ